MKLSKYMSIAAIYFSTVWYIMLLKWYFVDNVSENFKMFLIVHFSVSVVFILLATVAIHFEEGRENESR
jgi:hypothetical protein